MPAVSFTHNYVGSLTIDNGIDDGQWGYGLNTQTFPTFGGEVVQILSVYIDDLTLTGTCATYAQAELIYKFFARYFMAATQGTTATSTAAATTGQAYNLNPVIFTYPARNWTFSIYPMSAPGFTYATGMVGPRWQVTAHVIDDSPDLSIIKNGIKAAAVSNIGSVLDGGSAKQIGKFSLTGNISPKSGQPNTDPFQTANPAASAEQAQASQWADYYNSLIPSYMKGDFSSLVGTVGSQPNFGTNRGGNTNQASLSQKTAPKKVK